MGKRGPRPTPTKELAERGSWRAKTAERQNEIEVLPVAKAPAPPSWLKGDAAKCFKAHAKVLTHNGMLAETDVAYLAMLCAEYGHYIECYQEALGSGALHPAWKEGREAFDRYSKGVREFGLSPSARVGLPQPKDKPKGKVIAGLFAKG